jgi:hypothetical protein
MLPPLHARYPARRSELLRMSVAIASAALAFSVATFITTFLTNQRKDRRDLFLRIHEGLVSVDQQRGRHLIHELLGTQRKNAGDLTDDQREAINNALSTLNVACFYYVRRYINPDDMLETWAESILRAFEAAEAFLDHRKALWDGGEPWPNLRVFATDARTYVQERRAADKPSRRGAASAEKDHETNTP